MSRLRAPALFLSVLGLIGTPWKADAQLRPPEVREVRFEGNETFPSDSLARAIATRETECKSGLFNFPIPLCPLGIGLALNRSQLRERDLPRDRARLVLWYRQRGFRDVQVDTPTVFRTAANARVVFSLTEGRPVVADSITYTGVEGLGFPDLLEGLPLSEGDRLSTIALDATRDSITNRLANRGYAYAEVYRNALRPEDDPYNASVTFDVDPGPVSTYGAIRVSGIENLSVRTVLRTVQISSGGVYRLSEIDEATTRLYGLQIVQSASIRPIRSDTLSLVRDSVIDVEIEVREGDAYRVRAGGGVNTAECLNVEARWTSRNFIGGGRLLQIRGRVGNILAADFREVLCNQSGRGDYGALTGLASVEFVQPWIFSTRNSLSASVFAERQALPNIFIRKAVGAQLALSRTIAPQTILTGFYRPEVSELNAEDVLFCTGLLVCDPGDVRELEGQNFLSPVGVSLARDRSDDLLNPRQGYRVLADFEHAAAWTTSDFRYARVVAEASRYIPLGNIVLAGRIKGGWVGSGGFAGLAETREKIVHPQKRFYTGGASSVRGFAQSNLGPRVLFATPMRLLSRTDGFGWCEPTDLAALTCDPANGTEFQPRPTGGTRVLEVNAELRFPVASVFEGVIFSDAGQAWGRDQTVGLASLEVTPGVGIRFPSPVGPIRVDLAYRFRGAETLVVVTEVIEPYDPTNPDHERIIIRTAAGNEMRIDWVSSGTLSTLANPVLFGSNDGGLQLHFSIGQAF